MSTFRIDVAQWYERNTATPEENATFGEIVIEANGHLLTEVHDRAARTTRDGFRAAASSLAQWVAWNRWRLLDDVSPRGDSDWQQAHCLASAGGGYLWPSIDFCSDGQFVQIRHIAEPARSDAMVKFLSPSIVHVERSVFARALDDFLAIAAARLEAFSLGQSDIVQLIRMVQQEVADPEVAELRRVEALLQQDPDVIEETELRAVREKLRWMGERAGDEVLAASTFDEVTRVDDWALELVKSTRAQLMNADAVSAARDALPPVHTGELPWERGRAMAQSVRLAWGAGLSTLALEKQLGVVNSRRRARTVVERIVAAGFRDEAGGVRAFVPQKRDSSYRFHLARVLADALEHGHQDVLFAATDTASARQKLQRAFAQELLCPIDGILERIRVPDRPTESELEDTADYYGVSPWTVQTVLVNHGHIDRGFLSRT